MSPHVWSVTASDSALWLCRNEFRHTVHVSVANWAACLCSFHRNTHLQRGVCVSCTCDNATSTQPACGVHTWHLMRAEHKQPWCVRGLRSAVEIHPGRRRELHAQWDAHNTPAAHCSALAEQSSSPGWGHGRRSPACQAGQLFDSEAEWFCSPFWNSSILWLEPVTAGTGLSLVSAGLKGKSSLVLSASATVPTLWLQFLLFNPPWPQSFSYKCTLT